MTISHPASVRVYKGIGLTNAKFAGFYFQCPAHYEDIAHKLNPFSHALVKLGRNAWTKPQRLSLCHGLLAELCPKAWS